MTLFIFGYVQVKWLEDKLAKITNERDYFRTQWEKLHHAAMASARNAGQDVQSAHAMNAGQLDLSMTGARADPLSNGSPYANGSTDVKLGLR